MSGYEQKSEFAFSFSVKQNAKGEWLVEKLTLRSNEGKGLDLMTASYAISIQQALVAKGLRVVGLPDNKN